MSIVPPKKLEGESGNSNVSSTLYGDSKEIMRGLGDLLFHLGCDTGWLVPNTALNSTELNDGIARYQQRLDAMELEISQALSEAYTRVSKPRAPEPAPEPVPQASQPKTGQETESMMVSTDIVQDGTNPMDTNDDNLGNFDNNLNLGDEMDFYNMNSAAENFGMFDMDTGADFTADNKLGDKLDDGYGLMDDYF